MAKKILNRIDTAARWALSNPVIGNGEIVIASDTGIIKIGDGLTQYNSLEVFSAIGPQYMPVYTVAQAEALTVSQGAVCHISNEAGGYVPAFYDGTNWRRVTDRTIIS